MKFQASSWLHKQFSNSILVKEEKILTASMQIAHIAMKSKEAIRTSDLKREKWELDKI